MAFYLNEHSLHGQYKTPQQFITALKTILRCQKTLKKYSLRLFCRRTLSQRPAVDSTTFYHTLYSTPDRNLIRAVRIWLDRNGPFMEDDRLHPPDAYLSLADTETIVTDTSLGEAAYRRWQDEAAHTLSFAPSNFTTTPLEVTLYLDDDDISLIAVPNFWAEPTLEAYLTEIRPQANSWQEVLARIEADFPRLILLPSASENLQGQVFNQILAERVLSQLKILDHLARCFDEQGRRTAEGHQLMAKFFQGQRAMFSDESETNKHRFKADLTFAKADGTRLFCPFHSKISYMTFRIHFSWPVRYQEPIYIAYIGPKITKT